MSESPANPDPRNDDSSEPTVIVGIGASAGGLDAIEELFTYLPDNSGAAFVIVQHLSPDFRSLMDELLAKQTTLPIFSVTDGIRIEANCVYLMPPRVEMILSNGCLLLGDRGEESKVPHPIDRFFRSLAQDAAERSVGVVLSGSGSDGAAGIEHIVDAGGLVLIQELQTAKFEAMPRASLQKGLVDSAVSLNEIARQIVTRADLIRQQEVEKPESVETAPYGQILHLLQERLGVNFHSYKPGTIGRRIERRRYALGQLSEADYLERIRQDDDELKLLQDDLLIGVTEFFRDPPAWQLLEKLAIPELLASEEGEGEFRAWVAGCSTGQEAYSLAYVVHQRMQETGKVKPVKLFATDVDAAALEKAASAEFSETEISSVPQDRRERMFEQRRDKYVVRPVYRNMIVFASHDLLTDPPFTRIDLVLCRNVLIYLKAKTQKRILSLFHFGLVTNGVLFLGSSETPSDLLVDMEIIDGAHRIYRKCRSLPLPPQPRVTSRRSTTLRRSSPTFTDTAESAVRNVMTETYHSLLTDFMPSSLLVNDQLELVQVFGAASRYLSLAEGRFTGHIQQLTDHRLAEVLSSLHAQALNLQKRFELRHVGVPVAGDVEPTRISIQRVEPEGSRLRFWLFVFTPESLPADPREPPDEIHEALDPGHIQLLEDRLTTMRDNLQSTIEALEQSNEELHATNEELVASNEELQSTNEELNSVNEELFTVNSEHQSKIDELVEVTNDLENLLRSSQIGTVFLDRDLMIRRFTPAAARYFNLRPHDVGRSVTIFKHILLRDQLLDDLKQVLQSGQQTEFETRAEDQRYLLIRIFPYLAGSRVSGVVLTLVDITAQKEVSLKYERTAIELDELYRTAPVGLAVMDSEQRYLRINDYLASINGKSAADHIGRHIQDAVPELVDRILPLHQHVMQTGKPTELAEVTGYTAGDPEKRHTWLVRYHPIKEGNEVIAVSAIVTDITDLKEFQQQLERKTAELERSNEELEQFAYAASHDLQEPLRTIATYCEAIEEDYRSQLDDEGVRYLDFVVDATHRMRNQIRGLLEYSRIGRTLQKADTVDLNRIFQDVCEDLETCIREAAGEVSSDQLPVIRGDARLLRALLQNLISNSLKFHPSDRNPVVSISSSERESDWVVRVVDNGIGIAPSQEERIFQVFQRLHKSGDYPGTGIGLSLCKRIVELHGGIIRLVPSTGKGSCFEFSLPKVDESTQGTPSK